MKKTIKRNIIILIIGYVVIIVFLMTFGMLYVISNLLHGLLDWSELSPTLILVIALICSIPVALPFFGERLTKVKLFEFEIALSDVAASISQVLPNELKDTNRLQLGTTLTPEISNQIKTALKGTKQDELIEVNLGNGQIWLATRLYLLAALAENYTKIGQVVILENRDGKERCFIGFTSPHTIRRALASKYPVIEKAYGEAYQHCLEIASAQEIGPTEEVEWIVQNFGLNLQQLTPGGEAELESDGVKEWITKPLLNQLLSVKPHAQSVNWNGSPITPLLLYQILQCSSPFVALVGNQQLMKVVNRATLATRISKSALEQRFK